MHAWRATSALSRAADWAWPISLLPGATPVPQAIAQCERIIADLPEDRQVESIVMCIVAQLRAMNGEFDVARALYRRGRTFLRDLGQGVSAASTGIDLAARRAARRRPGSR